MPQKQPKRTRPWLADGSCPRQRRLLCFGFGMPNGFRIYGSQAVRAVVFEHSDKLPLIFN